VAEANADALHLRRIPVDLDELLRSMVDLYEPSLSERGLKVMIRSSAPLIVSADAALLHRMLANLLDNALKHLPPGTNIHMQLETFDGFGRLEMEDDGPGFPPEVVNRPFEKYVKGNQSTGSGLGLAFAEAVVRRMEDRSRPSMVRVEALSSLSICHLPHKAWAASRFLSSHTRPSPVPDSQDLRPFRLRSWFSVRIITYMQVCSCCRCCCTHRAQR